MYVYNVIYIYTMFIYICVLYVLYIYSISVQTKQTEAFRQQSTIKVHQSAGSQVAHWWVKQIVQVQVWQCQMGWEPHRFGRDPKPHGGFLREKEFWGALEVRILCTQDFFGGWRFGTPHGGLWIPWQNLQGLVGFGNPWWNGSKAPKLVMMIHKLMETMW